MADGMAGRLLQAGLQGTLDAACSAAWFYWQLGSVQYFQSNACLDKLRLIFTRLWFAL